MRRAYSPQGRRYGDKKRINASYSGMAPRGASRRMAGRNAPQFRDSRLSYSSLKKRRDAFFNPYLAMSDVARKQISLVSGLPQLSGGWYKESASQSKIASACTKYKLWFFALYDLHPPNAVGRITRERRDNTPPPPPPPRHMSNDARNKTEFSLW